MEGARKISTNAVLGAALAVSLMAGYLCGSPSAQATAAPAAGSAPSLGAGQTGPRSAVPWQRVGAGWMLIVYWPGRFAFDSKPKAAPVTMYLYDPAGGRYRIYQWPSTTNPPDLRDWSGDKTRAVLSTARGYEQLTLATGKISQFRLAGKADLIGYTRPLGRGFLVTRDSGRQLDRYRLTGHLAKILLTGREVFSVAYSGTGQVLAVGAPTGIQLITNDGRVIRALPIPRAGTGCFPSRWWNSSKILAWCRATKNYRRRLWLVPADGSKPTPLTPPRSDSSPDPGDVDAWQLPGRLYVQALASSGRALIFQQVPSQEPVEVGVPDTANDNWIVATRGRRLLVASYSMCGQSSSLLWFNPSTRREQVLIQAPADRVGLAGGVLYGQSIAAILVQLSC
jgi:hypothetical protein